MLYTTGYSASALVFFRGEASSTVLSHRAYVLARSSSLQGALPAMEDFIKEAFYLEENI